MDKQLHLKFVRWVKAVTSLEIATKTDIAAALVSSSGKTMTKPGLTQLLNPANNSHIHKYHMQFFYDAFPFTSEKYFNADGELISYSGLITYLCDRFGVEKKYIAKELGIQSSKLSRMNNHSNEEDVQAVFDYFNTYHECVLYEKELKQVNLDSGFIPGKHVHRPMVYRLLQFYEHLLKVGVVIDKADFADQLGENNRTLYRIFKSKGKLGVPLSIVVAVGNEFPELNLRWFLTGRESMFGEGTPENYPKTKMIRDINKKMMMLSRRLIDLQEE